VPAKLKEFGSRLEELILNLEKSGIKNNIDSKKINALKPIIPVIKKTADKFPHADDNQIASWALTVIVMVAPWIITAPKNERIAAFLRDLDVTDLYLSGPVKRALFGKQYPDNNQDKVRIKRTR
jgi:hypothetical protein